MIDLMNRSLLSGFMALETGRAIGMTLLSQFGPLRRAVMQYGLAPSAGLPPVMRPPHSAGDIAAAPSLPT